MSTLHFAVWFMDLQRHSRVSPSPKAPTPTPTHRCDVRVRLLVPACSRPGGDDTLAVCFGYSGRHDRRWRRRRRWRRLRLLLKGGWWRSAAAVPKDGWDRKWGRLIDPGSIGAALRRLRLARGASWRRHSLALVARSRVDEANTGRWKWRRRRRRWRRGWRRRWRWRRRRQRD